MILLSRNPACAQDSEEARAAAEAAAAAARAAAQAAEQAQEMSAIQQGQDALAQFMRDLPGPARLPTREEQIKAMFPEFRKAVPLFRAATNDYRLKLNQDGKIDAALKTIKAQATVMLNYFSVAKIKHASPDLKEFKGLSKKDLQRETLRSAERINASLNFAVKTEQEDVVSAETLTFLSNLDGELHRLKWLSSHAR